MNAAARLIYSSSRFDHITPLIRQLHWLKAKEQIDFKLALLMFKCVHWSAPPYLADELNRPADSQARCRLRSASSSTLVVRRTGLTTVGNRSFPVAASLTWNNLPHQHVITSPSLRVFKNVLRLIFFFFLSLIHLYILCIHSCTHRSDCVTLYTRLLGESLTLGATLGTSQWHVCMYVRYFSIASYAVTESRSTWRRDMDEWLAHRFLDMAPRLKSQWTSLSCRAITLSKLFTHCCPVWL